MSQLSLGKVFEAFSLLENKESTMCLFTVRWLDIMMSIESMCMYVLGLNLVGYVSIPMEGLWWLVKPTFNTWMTTSEGSREEEAMTLTLGDSRSMS